MYTKQEKLAAARKKLKEFQGKQRENDLNTKNAISPSINTCFKDSSSSLLNQIPPSSTSGPGYTSSYHENMFENAECKPEEKLNHNSIKETHVVNALDSAVAIVPILTHNQSIFDNLCTDIISFETSGCSVPVNDGVDENSSEKFTNTVNKSTVCANGLFSGDEMKYVKPNSLITQENSDYDKLKLEICTLFKDPEVAVRKLENNNDGDHNSNSIHNNNNSSSGIVQSSQTNPERNDPKDFFWTTFTSVNKLHEMELQNKDMPILSHSQLVEENTSLSQVLKRTEELLKYKTDQEQNLSQNVSFLQLKVSNLEGSIFNAENEIQKLKVINEQLMKQKDSDNNALEEIKQMYESIVEQHSELQQKLELKTKECEYLSIKLQEMQTQLSSSLIKIQQLNTGESSALNLRVTELQNENVVLTKRLQDLEKTLDIVNKEKEESSHSFQTYAQQCNSQLSSLSSEVRNLTKENRFLREKNNTLEKSVKDLESQKNELKPAVDHPDLKSLSNKLSELTEENEILHNRLKEKMVIIEALQNEKKEKLDEINQMFTTLQEIRYENLKLIEEREKTNNNEKLLAAMESDKVAAARAVSQNQKLKDQIYELEEGFIKLSHEKLKLTDELALEKHMKKEIELRLQELQSNLCHEHDHHPKSSDTTINESADIEELKNIVRQLEEDKTELISRLNSSNSVKTIHSSDEIGDVKSQECNEEYRSDENEDSEKSKILLQQMEEKVKKTMNEIAALDEEKEKLEHLVLQLQGETETIGEYISLYQTQRMLLHQRSKEKDYQLLQLSKDKEELKSKLSTLNDLVIHLLAEKGTEYEETTDVSKTVHSHSSTDYSEETAAKIQTLITEIQSTNLIDNQSVAFEHCPCCSGRLITV